MTTDDAGGTQNNALQIDTPSQRSDHIHIVIGTRKPLDLEMTVPKFDACRSIRGSCASPRCNRSLY